MFFFSLQLINLLRNVLDHHMLTLQSAQLTRSSNYNDERYMINARHPRSAPNWAFCRQKTPQDMDLSGLDTNEEDNAEIPKDPTDDKSNEEDDDEMEAESSTIAARRGKNK